MLVDLYTLCVARNHFVELQRRDSCTASDKWERQQLLTECNCRMKGASSGTASQGDRDCRCTLVYEGAAEIRVKEHVQRPMTPHAQDSRLGGISSSLSDELPSGVGPTTGEVGTPM